MRGALHRHRGFSSSSPRFTTERPDIPVINVSALVNGDDEEAKLDCARAIDAACRQHGFFYVKGHGVPRDLLNAVLEQGRSFFALPQDMKDTIAMAPVAGRAAGCTAAHQFRGYQRLGENVTAKAADLHEAIDFFRELGAEMRNSLHHEAPWFRPLGEGRNQWPDERRHESLAGFRATYDAYVLAMSTLGGALMRGVALGLGLHENYFASSYDESFWVMRIIGYPVQALASDLVHAGGAQDTHIETSQQDQEVGLGCGAHTDYGCLTLLHADKTVGCLQVRSRIGIHDTSGVCGDDNGNDNDCRADTDCASDDKSWVAADPVEGALLVNIGDMLELWSGGQWTATEHRVLPPTPQAVARATISTTKTGGAHAQSHYRISVPFFFEPNFDAHIEPILETADSQNAASVIYGRHLLSKVQSNFSHDRAS